MVISFRDCRSPQPIIRWFPTNLFETVCILVDFLVFSHYDFESNDLASYEFVYCTSNFKLKLRRLVFKMVHKYVELV